MLLRKLIGAIRHNYTTLINWDKYELFVCLWWFISAKKIKLDVSVSTTNVCRSALQTLHRASAQAREMNHFAGGTSHSWCSFYESHVDSDRSCLNEWHAMDCIESRRPPSPDSLRLKWVFYTIVILSSNVIINNHGYLASGLRNKFKPLQLRAKHAAMIFHLDLVYWPSKGSNTRQCTN